MEVLEAREAQETQEAREALEVLEALEVREAQEMGIETMTPDEISIMLARYADAPPDKGVRYSSVGEEDRLGA